MTNAQKKQRMAAIVERLKEVYPEALCALDWQGEPWRLLIMGRLSAQCTDARVNLVCRELFDLYPTPKSVADAPLEELERIIRPCGLFRVKAQNTKDACQLLVEEFDGQLPDTMEELLRFPGVGRKVANLLLGDVHHKGGVVTDTHCIRIMGRLGMYPESQKDTPYPDTKELALSKDEKAQCCDTIKRMMNEGCPVFNLKSAFPYLIENKFPTPCHQCLVIEAGKISTCGRCIEVPGLCEQCGYFFVAEYTLLFRGNVKIIFEMLRTYLKYI